ncbi:hypothetical protein HMPREF0673_00329 [Leyella stercorea DSM 18206]|uniref:Uncharacterized protein n=1 Tax=Leyella stercorea DSM 18206 TaxID=1002367 RepID=G6AUP4_9BACT|nr:hypothetical protein HMPREF0673_00329 [Leyella stercorea DSM 18206]
MSFDIFLVTSHRENSQCKRITCLPYKRKTCNKSPTIEFNKLKTNIFKPNQ